MGAPHEPHVPHHHSPRPTPSVLRISLHRSRASRCAGHRRPTANALRLIGAFRVDSE
jgi:hypothetical protein